MGRDSIYVLNHLILTTAVISLGGNVKHLSVMYGFWVFVFPHGTQETRENFQQKREWELGKPL